MTPQPFPLSLAMPRKKSAAPPKPEPQPVEVFSYDTAAPDFLTLNSPISNERMLAQWVGKVRQFVASMDGVSRVALLIPCDEGICLSSLPMTITPDADA